MCTSQEYRQCQFATQLVDSIFCQVSSILLVVQFYLYFISSHLWFQFHLKNVAPSLRWKFRLSREVIVNFAFLPGFAVVIPGPVAVVFAAQVDMSLMSPALLITASISILLLGRRMKIGWKRSLPWVYLFYSVKGLNPKALFWDVANVIQIRTTLTSFEEFAAHLSQSETIDGWDFPKTKTRYTES